MSLDYEQHLELLNRIIDESERIKRFVDETKDSISELDKKLDLHIQKTTLQYEQTEEKGEAHQKRLLEYQVRLDTFTSSIDEKYEEYEANYENIKKQVERLERPRIWIVNTGKVIITIGAIASAVYSIYQLLTMK
jgi:predicted nuclease with TOPRIM domain